MEFKTKYNNESLSYFGLLWSTYVCSSIFFKALCNKKIEFAATLNSVVVVYFNQVTILLWLKQRCSTQVPPVTCGEWLFN